MKMLQVLKQRIVLLTTIALLMTGSTNVFAQETARLQVIHNAADPAAALVDIYLNGDLLLDDFAFRAATGFIDAPANTELEIGVAPYTSESSEDIIATIPVTLMAGETYVAMANGVLDPGSFAENPDGRSIGFTLFAKDGVRESGMGSDVDFFVVHGATDAPTVDVIARDVATLVDNAAYGDMTDYISVPAASYILDITPGEDNETVVASFNADLSALGGGSAVVLASGFLNPAANQDGEAFGLIAVLADGTVVALESVPTGLNPLEGFVASEYQLSQNYPNPFNPTTTISFAIPQSGLVKLNVYNIMGQMVASLVNRNLEPGSYQINFDASQLTSGTYFYTIQAGDFKSVKKMVLLK